MYLYYEGLDLSKEALFPIVAVISQNDSNKSYLVCVKSEKYAFLVTPRNLESKRQRKAELQTFHYYLGKAKPTWVQIGAKQTHSELPWGHRKISKIDETYTKLKFGTSDGIIVHYFWNFDWILAKFCNFMMGGRGLISWNMLTLHRK